MRQAAPELCCASQLGEASAAALQSAATSWDWFQNCSASRSQMRPGSGEVRPGSGEVPHFQRACRAGAVPRCGGCGRVGEQLGECSAVHCAGVIWLVRPLRSGGPRYRELCTLAVCGTESFSHRWSTLFFPPVVCGTGSSAHGRPAVQRGLLAGGLRYRELCCALHSQPCVGEAGGTHLPKARRSHRVPPPVPKAAFVARGAFVYRAGVAPRCILRRRVGWGEGGGEVWHGP